MRALPTDDAPNREPTRLAILLKEHVHSTISTDSRSSWPSSPSTCRPQPSSTFSACLGPAVHGLFHAARGVPRLFAHRPTRVARLPPCAAPQPLRFPRLQPLIVLLIMEACYGYTDFAYTPLTRRTRIVHPSRATNRSLSRSRRRTRRTSASSSAWRSM
ncbi:hypothetical protein C8J57DRAFT_1335425 [Mycena rebaudengoi]|nr:hypothetical protein C8J57DRAFT_1335425 [Mycena rebaudengoi]